MIRFAVALAAGILVYSGGWVALPTAAAADDTCTQFDEGGGCAQHESDLIAVGDDDTTENEAGDSVGGNTGDSDGEPSEGAR